MKTQTQLISIQYARCIKWTQGQLDAAPWSAYQTASAGVSLIIAPSLLDECIDYSIVHDGQVIGEGESENKAIADAQWFLMNESRQEAKAHAIAIAEAVINPAWIEAGKGPHIDIP